jgi:hypothetical protein
VASRRKIYADLIAAYDLKVQQLLAAAETKTGQAKAEFQAAAVAVEWVVADLRERGGKCI